MALGGGYNLISIANSRVIKEVREELSAYWRVLETILFLRFFIFQCEIVYKLQLIGNNTSLLLYGFSWVVLDGIVMIYALVHRIKDCLLA
ncbi:unnamed protein product [Lactuca virosa]|uniref:Transmembrane protein 147 n=1 Tax=Lactuca virosa TaxID=75947 RepID=A0AAU9PGB2_9ASTR|nr:unnamed protein product [Lactuca virosa]